MLRNRIAASLLTVALASQTGCALVRNLVHPEPFDDLTPASFKPKAELASDGIEPDPEPFFPRISRLIQRYAPLIDYYNKAEELGEIEQHILDRNNRLIPLYTEMLAANGITGWDSISFDFGDHLEHPERLVLDIRYSWPSPDVPVCGDDGWTRLEIYPRYGKIRAVCLTGVGPKIYGNLDLKQK